MKNLILIILLISWSVKLLGQNDRTETYQIRSMQGVVQKITLSDLGNETAILMHLGHKLIINNYWGGHAVSVVKGKFLKIEYAVRGGSCVGIGRVMVLCVSQNRLIVALDFMNRLTGCGAGEDDVYSVKFEIKYLDGKYTIPMHIYDAKHFDNPKIGKSYHRRYYATLNFDNKINIFYNGSASLKGKFITGFTDDDRKIIESVDGTFKTIQFAGVDNAFIKHYYINNHWYERGADNYLLKDY